ncbi:MAG: nitroreductase family protein [Chloroflexi bacterium]|nr:nitroreductase family protein [Chloroflexota bacterium]
MSGPDHRCQGAPKSPAVTLSQLAAEALRPLRRVRQIRQFTDVPLTDDQLDAIVDVGRWSGSSKNTQPWRFIVIRDVATIARIHVLGVPSTRSLATATAVIAIVVPSDTERPVTYAFDEGRAAERLLIAANLLGLAGAIAWLTPPVRVEAGQLLGLPADRLLRTVLALGHPSPEALEPKSPGVPARLPRNETVFEERWPASESVGDDPALRPR